MSRPNARREQTSLLRRSPRPRGMAVVIVLVLLSITLAFSYSMLRLHSTTAQMQRNQFRSLDARQAALAGLSAGLREMHQSSWSGADSSFSRTLGTNRWFQVTYQTGDTSLSSGDPDYAQYPYRVTVTSTGHVRDSARPEVVAHHKVQAVLQLVARKTADEPTHWQRVQEHTLYQWKAGDNDRLRIDLPARIEGSVHLQNALQLFHSYPEDQSTSELYAEDLNEMRLAGQQDMRPLNGPLEVRRSDLNWKTQSLLDRLGVAVQSPPSGNADWSHPGTQSEYQLYPGGRSYRAQRLPSRLQNVTLTPDPLTNPLGLFYHLGRLEVRDNVQIRGTLVLSSGDLDLLGRNILIEPASLPPLDGSDVPIHLPTVVAAEDVEVHNGAEATVRGLVAIWDQLEVKQASQDATQFLLEGRVLARRVAVRGREEWLDHDEEWWQERYSQYQELTSPPPFPTWLQQNWQLNPQPQLRVAPSAEPGVYHWRKGGEPVYVPHADDEGLRWQLVSWQDNL